MSTASDIEVRVEILGQERWGFALPERPWHAMSPAEVIGAMGVDPRTGLDSREAARRLSRLGENALKEARPRSRVLLFVDQFKDVMVLVLLAATSISYLLGERGDALTIMAIVLVNAVLGFIQEERAARSLAALRELAAPTARVRRDGIEVRLPAREVTAGDILLLEAGDRPSADARLIESFQLRAEEAALTGEAAPVAKAAEVSVVERAPVGDRKTMIFSGTTIATGRAVAVVTEIGMGTEMGTIAGLVQSEVSGETPLQKRLAGLGRTLVFGCVALTGVVVLTGALRGEDLYHMFLTGVSLAVAAIPEGLPAIVTVALAVGVQRMIKRKAVVRRLPAVETLGSATVICTDKTGTLTKNAMTVRMGVLPGGETFAFTGEGYESKGQVVAQSAGDARALLGLLEAAVLASNGEVGRHPKTGRPVISGDPLEAALWVATEKAGGHPRALRESHVRKGEIPFDAAVRKMSVAVDDGLGGIILYEKGALEVILAASTSVLLFGSSTKLESRMKEKILDSAGTLAKGALRIIAVSRAFGKTVEEAVKAPRTYLGIVGMIDPPRPGVAQAVSQCRRAGIRVVMITGDHPETAAAIGREVGILGPGERLVTGDLLEGTPEEEWPNLLRQVSVCARVSPSTKLGLVRAFKATGEIVAMTGDGVNDAPAVKEADIGVAMGQSGSEVTKEASALVLADDNFSTIVAAVEEGRGIYDNIRKFVRYLLACNVGEILVMFLAALLGAPLPLIPIQILWVNLVTDGLPAMALGLDPIDKNAMDRPPRPPGEGIFARRLGVKIVSRGVLIGVSTLGIFLLAVQLGDPLAKARTMAFAALVFAQLFHVFDCRSETRSIFDIGLLSNPFLIVAVLSSVALLLLAIYLPALRPTFQTWPLDATDWLLILSVSGLGSITIGVRRFFLLRRLHRVRARQSQLPPAA